MTADTRPDLPTTLSAVAIRSYMRATGWTEGPHGSCGSVFERDGFKVSVPHEDDDPDATRAALYRLAVAERRDAGVTEAAVRSYRDARGSVASVSTSAVTSPAPAPARPPAASTEPPVPVSEAAVQAALDAVAPFWKEAHAVLQAYPSAALARAMLEGAAHLIRADERERIRRLAVERGAVYCRRGVCTCIRLGSSPTITSFADLIREPS